MLEHSSAFIFDWNFFILAGNIRTAIKSWMSLKFGQIGPWTVELTALEHLEKSQQTYHVRNVETTLASSFLNGSFSFKQVSRT